MNKLLTHKGGQPVYLEDLDFIQESFAESFKNFVRAITDQEDIDEPIVLAGMKRFGSHGIESGIIAFGGRIFVVKQHDDIDDGYNRLNFIKTTGEPRRLKNGSTVDVYEYEDKIQAAQNGSYSYYKWRGNCFEKTEKYITQHQKNMKRSNIQIG